MFKEVPSICKSDDEIKGAEEKFSESLQLAQMGMYHLLENDVSQKSNSALHKSFIKFIHYVGRANLTNGIFCRSSVGLPPTMHRDS